MQLTVGPNLYFWDADAWSDFYARLADEAPVDRVVVGELVCSKRLPFYRDRIMPAVERLRAAGKDVALTSLALITLKRERALMAELTDAGLEIEVNDFTVLSYIPAGTAFAVGPLVNVYNEGTAAWLVARGASRLSLPPEVPLPYCDAIAGAVDVPVEAWGWGRMPLAISARCYHARLHDSSKDNCQFVCKEDPDGLVVETLDDQHFLAVNGVQTLSARTANAARHLDDLRRAGVAALRLSPQSEDFVRVCTAFRDLAGGRIDVETLEARLLPSAPGGAFADGFLAAAPGASWSGPSSPAPS